MARSGQIDFETVCELGRALEGVEAGTAYGSPALKLRGKLLACIPTHRSAEPNSVAVRLDFVTRDLLIAKDPATYYVKPHYVPYPCVLVRLDRISRTDLKEILEIAWRYGTRQSRNRPARRGKPDSKRR